MDELPKKRSYAVEIVGAFVLLLVSVALLFPNPGITGFVSVETKSQPIDLSIANSQSYILTTGSEEQFYLTSLKLSGEVIGDGVVKIYLSDSHDNNVLVYSNIADKHTGLGSITGMDKITGLAIQGEKEPGADLILEFLENVDTRSWTLGEDEEVINGNFKQACVDSCFIEMMLDKDMAYELIFSIQEGTVLQINELVYTIRID